MLPDARPTNRVRSRGDERLQAARGRHFPRRREGHVLSLPAEEKVTESERPVRGAQGVARALAEAGIELVVGMPGGHTGAIYDALHDYQDVIRVLLVREE